MLVSSSYPLPFAITSTENILLLLPTTNNKSAPDPLPDILISGGIQFAAFVPGVVLISSWPPILLGLHALNIEFFPPSIGIVDIAASIDPNLSSTLPERLPPVISSTLLRISAVEVPSYSNSSGWFSAFVAVPNPDIILSLISLPFLAREELIPVNILILSTCLPQLSAAVSIPLLIFDTHWLGFVHLGASQDMNE